MAVRNFSKCTGAENGKTVLSSGREGVEDISNCPQFSLFPRIQIEAKISLNQFL